jgi:hypothetical protein
VFLAHSFRLRDPWQCDCLTTGATRWSRVFHRPTGLEDDDALWLVCSGLPAEASVTLNGVALSRNESAKETASGPAPTPCATGVPPVSGAHQYEVTTLLADTNKVELLIPSDPTASSLQTPASPPPFPYDLRLGIIGHS